MTSDLQRELGAAQSELAALQSRTRSYMRLSEDRQRLLLSHAESIQAFAYRRVRDAEDLASEAIRVVSSAGEGVRECFAVVAVLLAENRRLSTGSKEGGEKSESEVDSKVLVLVKTLHERLENWVRDLDIVRAFLQEKVPQERVDSVGLDSISASTQSLDRSTPPSAWLLSELRRRMGLYPSAIHADLAPAVRSSRENLPLPTPSTPSITDIRWTKVVETARDRLASIDDDTLPAGSLPSVAARLVLDLERRPSALSEIENGTSHDAIPVVTILDKLSPIIASGQVAKVDVANSASAVHALEQVVELVQKQHSSTENNSALFSNSTYDPIQLNGDGDSAASVRVGEGSPKTELKSGAGVDQLKRDFHDALRREEEMRLAFDDLRGRSMHDMNRLADSEEESRARLEVAEEHLSRAISERNDLSLQCDHLAEQLQEMRRHLESAEGSRVDDEAVDRLRSELHNAVDDIAAFKSDLWARDERIRELSSQVFFAQNDSEFAFTLPLQLSDTERAFEELSDLQQIRRQLEIQLSESDARLNRLEHELSSAVADREELTHALDSAGQFEKDLLSDLEGTQSALHSRTEALHAVEARLRDVEAELAATKQECEELREVAESIMSAAQSRERLAEEGGGSASSPGEDGDRSQVESGREADSDKPLLKALAVALGLESTEVDAPLCLEQVAAVVADRDSALSHLADMTRSAAEQTRVYQSDIADLVIVLSKILGLTLSSQMSENSRLESRLKDGPDVENQKAPEAIVSTASKASQTTWTMSKQSTITTSVVSLSRSSQTDLVQPSRDPSTQSMTADSNTAALSATVAELALSRSRVSILEDEVTSLREKLRSGSEEALNERRYALDLHRSLADLETLRQESKSAETIRTVDFLSRVARSLDDVRSAQESVTARLEAKLADSTAHRDRLQREADALRAALDRAIADKDAVVASLRAQLQSGMEAQRALSENLRAVRRAKQDLELARLPELDNAARRAAQDAATTARRAETLAHELDATRAELADTHAEAARREASLVESARARDLHISELSEGVAGARAVANEAAAARDLAITEAARLADRLAESQARLELAEDAVRDLQEAAAALDRRAADAERELGCARADAERERADAAAALERQGELTRTVKSLKEELLISNAAAAKARERLEARVSELLADATRGYDNAAAATAAADEVAELRRQRDQLEQRLRMAQDGATETAARARAAADADRARFQLDADERLAAEVARRLDIEQQARLQLAAKLERATAALAADAAAREPLLRDLTAAEDQAAGLRAALAAAHQDLDAERSRADMHEHEMAALEAHAAAADDRAWQVQRELDAEAGRLRMLLDRTVRERDDAAAAADRLRHELARATAAAQNSAAEAAAASALTPVVSRAIQCASPPLSVPVACQTDAPSPPPHASPQARQFGALSLGDDPGAPVVVTAHRPHDRAPTGYPLPSETQARGTDSGSLLADDRRHPVPE
ncbi:hypothetical protein HK405_006403, partial [Cladochytrium tenue]